jgi:hypothetical protein
MYLWVIYLLAYILVVSLFMYLRVFFLPLISESSSFICTSVSSSFPHISLLTYLKSHSFPTGICGTFLSNISQTVIFLTHLSQIHLLPIKYPYLRVDFYVFQSHLTFHAPQSHIPSQWPHLRVIFLLKKKSFFLPIYSIEEVVLLPASLRAFFLSPYLIVVFLPVILTQCCFPSCHRTSVLFSFLSSYLSVVFLPVIVPHCCFPSCHLTSVLFSFL